MDELLAELEKTSPDLAAKFRTALASDTDARKGEASSSAKALKAVERERDKLKADLESAGATSDERVTKALKERDEAKAAAEAAGAALTSQGLKHAVEKKLGISDETRSRRAARTFLDEYADGVSLDETGALVGADKAIEAFRTAEGFYFADAPAAETPVVQIGTRPGSGPSAVRPVGAKGTAVPQTRAEKIEAHKARLSGAQNQKKKAG